MKHRLSLATIAMLALCSLPTTLAREQSRYELASAVRSDDVPDLLRACAPEVKDEIARRVQAVRSSGATQREADDRARTSLISQTQDISRYDTRTLTLQLGALAQRANGGSRAPDQALMLCLYDRRLSQLAGTVVSGLTGASSKAPGGGR